MKAVITGIRTRIWLKATAFYGLVRPCPAGGPTTHFDNGAVVGSVRGGVSGLRVLAQTGSL